MFSDVKAASGIREIYVVFFQAYATVVSAAEGKDPESEEYGKVDELKQYPFQLISCPLTCIAPSCINVLNKYRTATHFGFNNCLIGLL